MQIVRVFAKLMAGREYGWPWASIGPAGQVFDNGLLSSKKKNVLK
jgi:hypothetical protein